jgi:divalent metal cation (Fe/Co/Zn/Cd) transporter
VLTNYGPDKFLASVHVEVDDATTAAEIDRLQWKISKAVLVNHGITMSAVGVYPSNTGNSMTSMIKKKLRTYLAQFPEVLELHGLYLDEEENFLRMDVILDFDAKDRMVLYERIKTEIAGMFPEYKTFVQLDLDVSAL